MVIDLTEMQRTALGQALAPFADRVDKVAVYGSRAKGTSRPGSDIDLVIHGDVAPWKISVALDDSDLSIFADVVCYDEIVNERLRAEIDRDSLPLFHGTDLRTFARQLERR